jgi:hypothetical protein
LPNTQAHPHGTAPAGLRIYRDKWTLQSSRSLPELRALQTYISKTQVKTSHGPHPKVGYKLPEYGMIKGPASRGTFTSPMSSASYRNLYLSFAPSPIVALLSSDFWTGDGTGVLTTLRGVNDRGLMATSSIATAQTADSNAAYLPRNRLCYQI